MSTMRKITTIIGAILALATLAVIVTLALYLHAGSVQTAMLTKYGAAGANKIDAFDNVILSTHQECVIDLPSWRKAGSTATLMYECLPWVDNNNLTPSQGGYYPVAPHSLACTTKGFPGVADGTLTPCPSASNPDPLARGCSKPGTDAPCYFASMQEYCRLTQSTVSYADGCMVAAMPVQPTR